MAITRTSEHTVPADNGEVNLLIARQVDPGHEETFEAWAHGILETAAGFPDHLGYGLFRPATEGGPWFLVHRFRNQAASSAGRTPRSARSGSPTASATTTRR